MKLSNSKEIPRNQVTRFLPELGSKIYINYFGLKVNLKKSFGFVISERSQELFLINLVPKPKVALPRCAVGRNKSKV